MAENEISDKDNWKIRLYKSLQNGKKQEGSNEKISVDKKDDDESEKMITEEVVKKSTTAREVSGECVLYFDRLYSLQAPIGFIVRGSFCLKLKNLFRKFADYDYYKAVKIKKRKSIWSIFINKEEMMIYKLKFYKGIPKVNLTAEIIRKIIEIFIKENESMPEGVVQWIIIHYFYMVGETEYAYKRDDVFKKQENKEYLSVIECLGTPLKDEIIELEDIKEKICKFLNHHELRNN